MSVAKFYFLVKKRERIVQIKAAIRLQTRLCANTRPEKCIGERRTMAKAMTMVKVRKSYWRDIS